MGWRRLGPSRAIFELDVIVRGIVTLAFLWQQSWHSPGGTRFPAIYSFEFERQRRRRRGGWRQAARVAAPNVTWIGLMSAFGGKAKIIHMEPTWNFFRASGHLDERVHNQSATRWRKSAWQTGGLQMAFPPHLTRKRKQIGRQGDHCWRAWPPIVSRLIKALKLTGRRRFALRAVASCRLRERQESVTNFW